MDLDDAIIKKVWSKALVVPKFNHAKFRKDTCGAWIRFDKHGDRKSKYGWEIDHIDPDGSDALTNLRPLQWENNLARGDGKLDCVVTAKGKRNVNV